MKALCPNRMRRHVGLAGAKRHREPRTRSGCGRVNDRDPRHVPRTTQIEATCRIRDRTHDKVGRADLVATMEIVNKSQIVDRSLFW